MRETILNHAESIVQAKGLEALSFQQLADAAGLSKASVFHHFRNREALALALIGRCRTKYGAEYADISTQHLSAPQKLNAIAQSFYKSLRKNRLCLLSALGSSQDNLPKTLQLELKETAEAALRIFCRIFTQGQEEGSLTFQGKPEDAARGFLALLQGMQQLARYSGDFRTFDATIQAHLATLEA